MNDELYHAGIKGQKWGVRRYQNPDGSLTPAGKRRYNKSVRKAEKADQKIRGIETTRQRNKLAYDEMNAQARDKYSDPKKAKKLAKAEALNKADYDTSEVINKYEIARQKAKKDKNFKNSTEYMKAKADYGKYSAQTMIYGDMGHRRIEQLKNLGKTEKQAKRKVLTESALGMIGGVAITSLAAYGLSKATNG